MISDFVKGRQKLGYTVSIQKGIELHRAIDAFTDAHPATAKAKEIFRPHYRLYSGPFIDILYDHFLANDDSVFPDDVLLSYTDGVYRILEAYAAHLPQRFLGVLVYMKADNWLYNYRTRQGIQKSLQGLVRRASFITDSTTAVELFNDNYKELRDCYHAFFPDVKQMAKQKLEELLA
jgi:acyl carrier protein phosphodiesterase